MTTEFEVIGTIHGKERPRFANGHAYTPKQTKDYEELVKLSYIGQGGKYHGDCDVDIYILAIVEPPKSASKRKRAVMLDGKIRPSKRPDVDNVAKIVMDGLEGVCYKNDSQVIELSVRRIYGEQEKLRVLVIT